MSYQPAPTREVIEPPSRPAHTPDTADEPKTPLQRLRSFNSPTTARIIGLDIARGLAVLGMFGAHIGVTELFDWGQPATWLDLVNGRASILFAVLAGVSVAILSGRSQPLDGIPLLQARVRILVRAVLIFGIGGILQAFGVIAVILPMYAALFAISLPFLRWRSRRLFIAAGVTAIFAPVVIAAMKTYMPLDSLAFTDLMVFGVYPGLTWMAFLFAGMAIGRLDLTRLGTQLRLLVVGVVLAAVAYTAGVVGTAVVFPVPDDAGVSSGSSESTENTSEKSTPIPGSEIDFADKLCDDFNEGIYYCYPNQPAADEAGGAEDDEASDAELPILDLTGFVLIDPHSGTPLEVIGSGGFAMAVIALCLMAARRRVIRWVLYPLACVGAMALTAYSTHIVAIFALSDYTSPRIDNWPLLWFVLVALIVCTLWTTFLGRGPLERLLSRVSKRTATFGSHSVDASSAASGVTD